MELLPVPVLNERTESLAGEVQLGYQVALAVKRTNVMRERLAGISKLPDEKDVVAKVPGIHLVAWLEVGGRA